jgi:CelD/BcsL family acetyltransferase involved in cellulose biosynthesis
LPKESNQKLSYKKPQAQLAEVVIVQESEKKAKKKYKKISTRMEEG